MSLSPLFPRQDASRNFNPGDISFLIFILKRQYLYKEMFSTISSQVVSVFRFLFVNV